MACHMVRLLRFCSRILSHRTEKTEGSAKDLSAMMACLFSFLL